MNPRKKQTVLWNIQLLEGIPREYFVYIFFIFFSLYILWTAFSYTVLDYSFYNQLANKQQTGAISIPVTRGNVYASSVLDESKKHILATSVELSDLAIDPQMIWDTEKLRDFLVNILYLEMCQGESQEVCYKKVLRFLKKSDIANFNFSETYIKNLIEEKVESRISKTRVTSVLVRPELSPDDEKVLLSWKIKWLYPNPHGVYINPEELTEVDRLTHLYTTYFGEDEEKFSYKIRKRDLRYIALYQKLSLTTSDEIRYHLREEQEALEQWIISPEESIGKFLILTPRTQRIYPEHETWSQIIGFIDNAWVGHYGVEWYFHNELKWDPGKLVGKKDILWRPIEVHDFGNKENSSEEWVDIYTTIDRNIQKISEELIQKWVEKYWANKWTIVVMEPKTGKVLALANYPKYDPNSPWEVYVLEKISSEDIKNPETELLGKWVFVEDLATGDPFYFEGKEIFLREASREEYVEEDLQKYTYTNNFGASVYKNDAISSLYEPWSIMKAMTVAIGIDSGEINAYERYQDIGKVTIDNFPIENDSDKCLGYHTFTHSLSYSCNIGMIRIVQRVWKALFHKYLHDFGFWDLSGIQLDGEVFWKIDPFERWPVSKLLTSSYGLWVSVTPLQMAAAYNVIANGWVYMRPYIIEKVVSSEGKVIEYQPQKIRRVLYEDTANTVTNMLVKGVQDGAARNAGVPGYAIAGKTGTSQIAYRGKYEEGVGSTYASFAWFAPAEDPLFVIVVKLERPRQNQYGGRTSAFIFSELAAKLLDYYQIPSKELK